MSYFTKRPWIAVSANLLARDPERDLYKGKQLQYAETEMLQWIWRHGGQPVVVPLLSDPAYERDLAQKFHGLILTGGADVSPRMYGEEPRRPEWAGQPERDEHEIRLLEAFLDHRRPVWGICRGHQLLNVAFGGTLHQDLEEDGVVDETHRCP